MKTMIEPDISDQSSVDKYIPDPEEIDLKGRLSPKMPRIISLIARIPDVWDELESERDIIYDHLTNFERRLISVKDKNGECARDEYTEILAHKRETDEIKNRPDIDIFTPVG